MLGPTRKHALGEIDPAPCRNCNKPVHEHDAFRRCADGVRRFSKKVTGGKRLEVNDQADLVAHMRRLGEEIVRCEQGGKRKYGAARDKALGVAPGYPDLIWPRSRGRTVWIECKTPTGELSPQQIMVHGVLRRMGHVVLTGYGDADLIRQVDDIRRNDP
jgi:hypothetical protein